MTEPSHKHFLENQIGIIRRVSDLWPGFWFSPRVVERVGGGSPAVQLKHYQWSNWPYASLEWWFLINYIFHFCLTTSQFTRALVPLRITHFTGKIYVFLLYDDLLKLFKASKQKYRNSIPSKSTFSVPLSASLTDSNSSEHQFKISPKRQKNNQLSA